MKFFLLLQIQVWCVLIVTAAGTDVQLRCPYYTDITWDILRELTIEVDHGDTILAEVCVSCLDYYRTQEKDGSLAICDKIPFLDENVSNLVIKGRQQHKLANMYSYICASGTIRSTLNIEDLTSGNVCETYVYLATILDVPSINETTSYYNVTFAGLSDSGLLRDLWHTSIALPIHVWTTLASRCKSLRRQPRVEIGVDDGDYTAHHIEFRSTLRGSTLHTQLSTGTSSSFSEETTPPMEFTDYNRPSDCMTSLYTD